MASRWLAFLIWGLVALTATSWLLRLTSGGMAVPLHAQSIDADSSLRGDLSRVLGKTAVAPATPEAGVPVSDGRLRLIGVIAPRLADNQADALALIAVGTDPAKAYRVGAVVDGDLRVLSVGDRIVELGQRDAGVQQRLELPPLPPAASASRPGAATNASPGNPGSPGAAGMPPMSTATAAPPMPGVPGLGPMPGVAVMPGSVPGAGTAEPVTGAPPPMVPPGISPALPGQAPTTNPP